MSRSRSLPRADLLFPLGFRAPLEFFAGHVFLVGGDPPRVAERVLHARAPVSVEGVHGLPQGGRTGFEGPSVRRVGVRHVQEQRHLDRLPLANRVAQLDDRGPEGDLRVDDPAGRIREPFLFPAPKASFRKSISFAASLTISTGVMVWYPSGIGFTWLVTSILLGAIGWPRPIKA